MNSFTVPLLPVFFFLAALVFAFWDRFTLPSITTAQQNLEYDGIVFDLHDSDSLKRLSEVGYVGAHPQSGYIETDLSVPILQRALAW